MFAVLVIYLSQAALQRLRSTSAAREDNTGAYNEDDTTHALSAQPSDTTGEPSRETPAPPRVATPVRGVPMDPARVRPALDFIVDNLMSVAGKRKALREAQVDIMHDRWFYTDDNARALEAFIVPGVYEMYKDEADDIVEFLVGMSRDGVLHSKMADTKLATTNLVDPSNFKCSNGIIDYSGDLNAFSIKQAFRRHDNAEAQDVLSHDGMSFKFRHNGEKYVFRSEEDKGAVSIENSYPDHILVRNVVKFAAEGADIAKVTYTYRVLANSAVTRIEVDFSVLSDIEATDVELRVVKRFDEGIPFGTVCYQHEGEEVQCLKNETRKVATDGMKWISLLQDGHMGRAYASHTLLRDVSLSGIELKYDAGRVTRMDMVYTATVVHNTMPFRVADHSLITSSGLHFTLPYADSFENLDKRKELTDFSTAADYGSALSSMASFAYFLGTGAYSIADPRSLLPKKASKMNKWCLKHLEVYVENFVMNGTKVSDEIHVRSHSFALIAAVKLAVLNKAQVKEFPGLVHNVETMLSTLLATQNVADGESHHGSFPCATLTDGTPLVYSLDCHASAMLALAYTLTTYHHVNPQVSKATIVDASLLALSALDYDTEVTVDSDADVVTLRATIAAAGKKGDGVAQHFKSGMLLRALRAFALNSEGMALALDSDIAAKVEAMTFTAQALLHAAKRRHHADTSEEEPVLYDDFARSPKTKQTNPETQAICTLGYFAEYEELHYEYLSAK